MGILLLVMCGKRWDRGRWGQTLTDNAIRVEENDLSIGAARLNYVELSTATAVPSRFFGS
jgi:hypothetical protein